MDLEALKRSLPALDREEALRHDSRQAAVAILLSPFEKERLEVLLMRRTTRADDRWSGQIGLPGGHAEAGDANLLATAVRETEEEVGVDLARSASPLGRLDSLQAKARGKLVGVRITPYVFVCTETVEPIPGPEADEAFWFPLHAARSGALDARYRYTGPRGDVLLPSWSHEGRIVWGLTYEILTRLIEHFD